MMKTLYTTILALIMLSTNGWSNVAFVNTNTGVWSKTQSISTTMTVNSGTNLAAFAFVSWDDNSGTSVNTITYGGLTMTSAGTAGNNTSGGNGGQTFVQIFYLANPPTGSNTLAITTNGTPLDLYANLVVFSGVSQTTPVRSGTYQSTTANASTIQLTISSNVNDLTISVLNPGDTDDGTTNQTLDGTVNGVYDGTAGLDEMSHDHATTASSSVTHIWNFTSGPGNAVMAGLSIQASPLSSSGGTIINNATIKNATLN